MIGRKDDAQKPSRWRLLPWKSLESILGVLRYGAERYGDSNWRLVLLGERGEERYEDAICRHLSAHMTGEEFDQDTGLPHVAHMAASCLFLLDKYTQDNIRGVVGQRCAPTSTDVHARRRFDRAWEHAE